MADDVNNTIENFDPRTFFPRVFASFTRTLALNIEQVAEAEDMRETPAWKAMEAFYHTDMDGFLES